MKVTIVCVSLIVFVYNYVLYIPITFDYSNAFSPAVVLYVSFKRLDQNLNSLLYFCEYCPKLKSHSHHIFAIDVELTYNKITFKYSKALCFQDKVIIIII